MIYLQVKELRLSATECT